MSTRIAIIGANGQLGSRLVEILGAQALPITRRECPLDDSNTITAVLDALKPDAIINAAAYTNVEKAEDEEALATTINATAPAHMAAWAHTHGVPFIHISTDYVFDGTKNEPYRETDATHAINAYGRSKEKGEQAVMSANADACVLRVSWLYDARGKNFFTTIGDRLIANQPLRIIADQHGTPCYAPDIANAVVQLLEAGVPKGIYHLVQQGETTWHGFAEAIRDAIDEVGKHPLPPIEPIASSEYPTRATRPANSRLDASLLYTTTGLRLPPWQDAVKRAAKERYED